MSYLASSGGVTGGMTMDGERAVDGRSWEVTAMSRFFVPRGVSVLASAGLWPSYGAAAAAHVLEEFLEERLSQEAFWQWLQGYPYLPSGSPDLEVEDEINRATLALRAFMRGSRSWPDVHRELLDARSRLSGLARHPR